MAGRGRYTDDIALPRMVHAAFVRSPYGHARILGIDTAAAAAHPGVVCAMTGAELARHCPPWSGMLTSFEGMKAAEQHAMATDRACWQGEPVAAVCARTRAEAEDAAELVEIEWQELPVVIDKERALGPGATVLHPGLGDNLAWRRDIDNGDVDAAFAAAGAVTVEETYEFGRHTAVSLEPRALLADWDPGTQKLTVHTSSQVPHMIKTVFARHLPVDEHNIRIVAPDVGGSFGLKIHTYGDRGRGLRAGDTARPAGQVRRRPARILRHRHPRPREPHQGAHGPHPGRRDHRAGDRRPVGRRRLLAVPPHQRVRGQPDPEYRRRALPARELPGGGENRLSQRRADLAVSRRRPPDRHLRQRGAARPSPPGPSAWTRSSCAGAT